MKISCLESYSMFYICINRKVKQKWEMVNKLYPWYQTVNEGRTIHPYICKQYKRGGNHHRFKPSTEWPHLPSVKHFRAINPFVPSVSTSGTVDYSQNCKKDRH